MAFSHPLCFDGITIDTTLSSSFNTVLHVSGFIPGWKLLDKLKRIDAK